MEESRFQLNYELSDYGKLRFEYDDGLSEIEMSKQRRKAMLKSPAFYVVVALLFLLFVWFVGSLIVNTMKIGFLMAISSHLSGLAILVVFGLIIMLSITGTWVKFMKLVSKPRSTSFKEFNSQEQEIENLRELQKNAIQIYEDYLVVTNSGVATVFDIHQLTEMRLDSADIKSKKFIVQFSSVDEIVIADVKIPNDKLILAELKKIFGNKLIINRPAKVAVKECNKPIGTLIGLTFFMLLPILAGIGIICMHCYVDKSIPIFLGAFFIIGGIMGLCGVYDFIPILKDILMPLLFGSVFIFFPISLLKLVYASNNIELTLKTFFGQFNVYSVAVVVFGFIAGICIYSAVYNVINYIRFRERKDK